MYNTAADRMITNLFLTDNVNIIKFLLEHAVLLKYIKQNAGITGICQ